MRVNRWTLAVLILAGSLSLVSTPAFAFRTVITSDGTPVRWNTEGFEYYIHEIGTIDIDDKVGDGSGEPVTEHEAIRRAFDAWAEVTGLEINYAGTFEGDEILKDKNAIMWVESGWTSELGFPDNALAVTLTTYSKSSGNIAKAQMYFNGRYSWQHRNSEDEPNGVDVQNIATHEAGHALGLDHSTNSAAAPENLRLATMFFAASEGETLRRDLENDDILGAKFNYTQKSFVAPTIDTIEPSYADNRSPRYIVELRGSGFSEHVQVQLTNSDSGEIVTGDLNVSSENLIVATFNMFTATTGIWDLRVWNSYDTYSSKTASLLVTGAEFATDSSSGGGCSINQRQGKRGFASTVLLLLVAILTLRWCVHGRSRS